MLNWLKNKVIASRLKTETHNLIDTILEKTKDQPDPIEFLKQNKNNLIEFASNCAPEINEIIKKYNNVNFIIQPKIKEEVKEKVTQIFKPLSIQFKHKDNNHG